MIYFWYLLARSIIFPFFVFYLLEQQTKEKKKKKGSHTCFKRAWRAVKGTFSRSRKNKVALFPSPSDPDPSDLQADPPVLEPTVLEEPAEIQPAREYTEQTYFLSVLLFIVGFAPVPGYPNVCFYTSILLCIYLLYIYMNVYS
ncbi:MAG: hypothetical protein ACRC7H_01755 [Plesiomonas shigelloides]